MNAPNRVEKSVVVMKIVDTIRECSGDGGFVKQVRQSFRRVSVTSASRLNNEGFIIGSLRHLIGSENRTLV